MSQATQSVFMENYGYWRLNEGWFVSAHEGRAVVSAQFHPQKKSLAKRPPSWQPSIKLNVPKRELEEVS